MRGRKSDLTPFGRKDSPTFRFLPLWFLWAVPAVFAQSPKVPAVSPTVHRETDSGRFECYFVRRMKTAFRFSLYFVALVAFFGSVANCYCDESIINLARSKLEGAGLRYGIVWRATDLRRLSKVEDFDFRSIESFSEDLKGYIAEEGERGVLISPADDIHIVKKVISFASFKGTLNDLFEKLSDEVGETIYLAPDGVGDSEFDEILEFAELRGVTVGDLLSTVSNSFGGSSGWIMILQDSPFKLPDGGRIKSKGTYSVSFR